MAEPGEINIRLDEYEIRNQVRTAVEDELRALASRFRAASYGLDPEFHNLQDAAWQLEIDSAYKRGYEDGQSA